MLPPCLSASVSVYVSFSRRRMLWIWSVGTQNEETEHVLRTDQTLGNSKDVFSQLSQKQNFSEVLMESDRGRFWGKIQETRCNNNISNSNNNGDNMKNNVNIDDDDVT